MSVERRRVAAVLVGCCAVLAACGNPARAGSPTGAPASPAGAPVAITTSAQRGTAFHWPEPSPTPSTTAQRGTATAVSMATPTVAPSPTPTVAPLPVPTAVPPSTPMPAAARPPLKPAAQLTNPAGPRAVATVVASVKAGPSAGDHFTLVRFADASHAWAAAGDDLLGSSDGGQHWHRRYRGRVPFRTLDPLTPELGWAQTDQALLFTADGGRSWQAVSTSGYSRLDHIQFLDRNAGWALNRDGVLHTGDGGHSWQPVTTPCTGPAVASVVDFLNRTAGWLLCGGEPGVGNQEKWLYRTTDAGRHWQLVTHAGWHNPAAAAQHRLTLGGYVSALSFVDPQHAWLVLARGGLFSSSDGGQTWTHLPLVADGGPAIRIAGHRSASAGEVLVDHHPSVLLATHDAGASWAQLVPPPAPDGHWRFFDGRHGVGAGTFLDPAAILRSSDGGQTWQQVGSIPSGPPRSPGSTQLLALSFAGPQHGWAVLQTANQTRDGTRLTLYRTSDGGATWAPLPAIPQDARDRYAMLSFVSATTGYAASFWGHLAVTHDGGQTFQPVSSADVLGTSDVRFVSAQQGWRIQDASLFSTSDGGRSWRHIPLGYRAQQIAPLSATRFWLIAADCRQETPCVPTLLTTADGGRSWTREDPGTLAPGHVIFADSRHGWLWDQQGRPYRTTDGGRTWLPLP